jgi:hypothetical protein
VTARQARKAPEPGRKWTKQEIRAEGARTTVPNAGSMIAGLCETASYELARRGQFPVSGERAWPSSR